MKIRGPMAYCARCRFKILTPLQIAEGASLTVTIPGCPPAVIDVGPDAYPSGQWIVIRMDGFETEDEAFKAGTQLGDVLSIVGAVTRLGIDIGFSRPTLQFSEHVHAAIKAESGKQLRTETHGLMVYEKDAVTIVGMEARGRSTIASDAFVQRLEEWGHATKQLTQRQQNCAALLNDSLFVPQAEGQFVLRVSAVEALCDQFDVGAELQAAITQIEAFVAGLSLNADVQETIRKSLSFQKKQSLRQSYMTKFRTLLSEDHARAFDALYQKRSALVHDGRGRGQLSEAANEAMDLACALLAAELK
ncbi:hypothetical protein [Mesorhizobium sp. M0187]|uniref:hypothetical protein n=1 Tax=Mesorhizobium sp. M0187 TaxID=2956908 RepID=UPI003334B098